MGKEKWKRLPGKFNFVSLLDTHALVPPLNQSSNSFFGRKKTRKVDLWHPSNSVCCSKSTLLLFMRIPPWIPISLLEWILPRPLFGPFYPPSSSKNFLRKSKMEREFNEIRLPYRNPTSIPGIIIHKHFPTGFYLLQAFVHISKSVD